MNSIVTERLSNHLQQAPLSECQYSKSSLFIFLSTGFSSIPFLSFSAVPTLYKLLINFHYKRGTAEEIIKKPYRTILKRFGHFQNNSWSQNFFCAFFFTQVQVKLIEVSCFTGTSIPNFKTPPDWLLFDILFFALSALEFHHMLVNAWRIII